MLVTSLVPHEDKRSFEPLVASPAALLIAKLHKIADRISQPKRLGNKDALDIWRILKAIPAERLSAAFERLQQNHVSAKSAKEALSLLHTLFAKRIGQGINMLLSATEGLENSAETSAFCIALAQDLLDAINIQAL